MDFIAEKSRLSPYPKYKSAVFPIVIIVSVVLVTIIFGPHVHTVVDWSSFREAALSLLDGRSPYTIYNYYNPPWLLIPIMPLAILPEGYGAVAFMCFAILAYLYVAIRSGASRFAVIAIMLNPVVLLDILKTNVNWVIPLGLLLPPWLGLFLVLAKPQVGIGLALYWLIESYQAGGIRRVAKTFLPVGLAYLLSFALFGPYIFHNPNLGSEPQNFSLFWPYAIPAGLALVAWTVRRKCSLDSLAASPVLTPYFGDTSWGIPFLALVRYKWLTIGLTLLLWALAILQFAYLSIQ